MTHHEWEIPRFSAAAVGVLNDLHTHGWSMRVVPLFQRSRLDWDAFTAAVNELHERRWVKIAWRRRPHTRRPPGMPERNTRADRITATRFARWRYIATWPDVW